MEQGLNSLLSGELGGGPLGLLWVVRGHSKYISGRTEGIFLILAGSAGPTIAASNDTRRACPPPHPLLWHIAGWV